LNKAASLLSWDMHVMMPAQGARVRAEQLATLGQLAHEMFIAPEVGRLLDELRPYEESLPYDSDEASLIRVARRDWDKAGRVPAELGAQMTPTAALANAAWVEARKQSDFALFAPYLEQTLALKHQYVECFDESEELYDILPDDYEPEMKTAEVRRV